MPDYYFYKWEELEKQYEAKNWKDIARLTVLKLQLSMQELRQSLGGITDVN